ncbi:hypothetical protein [Jeotgalibacillus malaysiensis]|uniref:hypothetical protein n=1 Tax=Jeotgalibacillus malaysiensis TaxID=1508404 RepID=UPI00384C7331
MSGRINRVGEQFGRLTVKRFIGTNKHWHGIWECECVCGNITNVHYSNLYSGITKSCGCLKRESTIKRNTKHGLSGGEKNATRLYRIWLHMRGRCLSIKNLDYKHYGARGISICKEWNDYKSFYDWSMESGYQENLTIERINNDGNYEPSNCRWATRKEQARNTRMTIYVEYEGETKTLWEWAEVLKINYQTLKMRLHRGWTTEEAFTTPLRNRRKQYVKRISNG